MLRIERPMFKQHTQLPAELDKQNSLTATVNLENVGRTLSIDLKAFTQIWIADNDSSVPAIWEECPKVGILAPHESIPCETAPLRATPDEVQGYKRRTTRLYIRVYAIYWDDVEADFRHRQSMCLFHTFGEPLDSFRFCASGNSIWHDNLQQREQENPQRPPGAP